MSSFKWKDILDISTSNVIDDLYLVQITYPHEWMMCIYKTTLRTENIGKFKDLLYQGYHPELAFRILTNTLTNYAIKNYNDKYFFYIHEAKKYNLPCPDKISLRKVHPK